VLTLAAAHRKGESDFDVVRAHGNVKFRRAESAVRHPTTWPSVVLRRLRTGLAAIYSASVRSTIASGPNTGHRVVTS
jgi:hypothetical protein